MKPKLVFHPSFEIRAQTCVDRIVRERGIYTLHNVTGTTQSKALTNADDSDVLAIIAAVRGDVPIMPPHGPELVVGGQLILI